MSVSVDALLTPPAAGGEETLESLQAQLKALEAQKAQLDSIDSDQVTVLKKNPSLSAKEHIKSIENKLDIPTEPKQIE